MYDKFSFEVIKLKTISKRIYELRTDNDMLQKQIAGILGISQQYYSEYETGKREIPIRHVKTLCLLYKVSADYILGLPEGLPYPKR